MDTNVIIILIGCATLLALTAIICNSIIERKMVSLPDALLSKKITKIHLGYIVGFLGLAVIMLLTANYGGPNNGIYEYLSFGSTITSLVLSVLAIFVTVRSSSDLNKQFSTISKVSHQIDSTLKNLKEAETQLKSTSSDITCQMDNIVSEIEMRLDKRLEKTESAISEKIQKQNLDTGGDKTIEEIKTTELDPIPFLERMSYNGLWTLYACSKGYEMKVRFIIEELFDFNNLYCLGVIITTKASGYINGGVLLLEKQHFVDCSETLFSSETVYDIIKKQPRSNDDDKEGEKNRIDEYFKNKNV